MAKVVGAKNAPGVVTLTFIAFWYALNVAFNLQNKVIFNYFPYPWFVSTVHVVIGATYCAVLYLLGAKKASFERVGAAGCCAGGVCVCCGWVRYGVLVCVQVS